MNDTDLKSSETISRWQDQLIAWFEENGNSYPWRNTTDPYEILVSEIMLQQTQIKAVLAKGYFERWLTKFPNPEALANAEEVDILKSWEGLGYYNRARNLQKAARQIIEDFDGVFPKEIEHLQQLIGVGRYTAGAVRSFAFDLPATIVDGNIIRVLSRVFRYESPVDTTVGGQQIWEWSQRLSSPRHPRLYNSAIMELGQRICTKDSPLCQECPVAAHCAVAGNSNASSYPIKKKTISITEKSECVLLMVEDSRILLETETGSRRRGLWKLPTLEEEGLDSFQIIGELQYSITRFKVRMKIFTPVHKGGFVLGEAHNCQWFDLNGNLPPLGSPYRKAIGLYALDPE